MTELKRVFKGGLPGYKNEAGAVFTWTPGDNESRRIAKQKAESYTPPDSILVEIPIAKLDDELRIVYGVVLEPHVVDAHNEWETPEAIERAAHKFLAKYNSETQLGLQHTTFGDLGVELVESYIAPQDIDFGGELTGDQIIKKGSWVFAVHVSDDTVWSAVKNGEITGFSIGGTATVLATEDSG